MIKYMKQTNKIYFNNEKVNEAIVYINKNLFKGKYGKSRETIERLNSLLEEVVTSLQVEEIQIEDERVETEEEAKKYFGDKFVKDFESIRKMCEENNLMLSIHGTYKEYVDKILDEGLKYKSPSMLSTSCIQNSINEEKEYRGYSKLLNWPHRQHKNLILIGIPKDCMGKYNLEENTGAKPIWRYVESQTNTGWEKKYLLESEFLIGYADIKDKEIINNKKFKLTHKYEGLVHDNDISYVTMKDKEENNLSTELEKYVNTEEDITYNKNLNPVKRLYEIETELLGALANISSKENGVLEDIATPQIDTIKNCINLINEAKEHLETNASIDEREKQNEQILLNNNQINQEFDEEWDWPDI